MMQPTRFLFKQLSAKKLGAYGRDFLLTWEKTREQLEATILVAQILRNMHRENISAKLFESGLAVSWFRDQSTRTRYSFRAASNLLGLSVQDFDEELSQLTHGETVAETATMLSFLTQVIGIRDDKYLGTGHAFQLEVADAVERGFKNGILAQRPSVINLQSDLDHPTQSLTDLAYLSDQFGGIEKLNGKTIAMSWAYSPSYGKPLSVAQGVVALMTRFGMNVVLAYPKGYELSPDIEVLAKKQAKYSVGSFSVVHDMAEAFTGADIVYPKSWAPYKAMQRRTKLYRKGDAAGLRRLERTMLSANAKHKDWQCTAELMRLTDKGKGLYLHCLPADVSGVTCKTGEVEREVFEKHRVGLFRQAGYKPFIIAAMILLMRFDQPVRILRRLLRSAKT